MIGTRTSSPQDSMPGNISIKTERVYSPISMSHMFPPYAGAAPHGMIDMPVWEVDSTHPFPEFSTMTSPTEDYGFHFAPTGPMDVPEDFPARWLAQAEAQSVMRRTPSPTSSGSRYRVSKPSSPRSRKGTGPTLSPAALAGLEFAATMSPTFLSYQNSPDPEPFIDSEPGSVQFGPLPDGLDISDFASLHVNPTHISQMRLDTDPSSRGMMPAPSWEAFSSPVSRTPSPNGSAWGVGLATPPQGNSSPIVKMSPSTAALSLDDDLGRHSNYLALFDDMSASRRPTLDGAESARDHPYYKMAAPQADGLYHCPFEGDPSCNHKPEKLKCNYDKFVDSHLKPYRCKNGSCGDARFSSTACLLRHEREAHAMHGHGDKPFLCTHDGCDRSLPGNGFPRQWNLRDHMKRVHHTSPPPPMAPASATAAQFQAAKARKRRSDLVESSAGRKASAAAAAAFSKNAAAAAAADAAAAKAKFAAEWRALHAVLGEIVPRLGSGEEDGVLGDVGEARRVLDEFERMYATRRV